MNPRLPVFSAFRDGHCSRSPFRRSPVQHQRRSSGSRSFSHEREQRRVVRERRHCWRGSLPLSRTSGLVPDRKCFLPRYQKITNLIYSKAVGRSEGELGSRVSWPLRVLISDTHLHSADQNFSRLVRARENSTLHISIVELFHLNKSRITLEKRSLSIPAVLINCRVHGRRRCSGEA